MGARKNSVSNRIPSGGKGMKKVLVFLGVGCFLFLVVGSAGAQALTLGTVSVTGDVRVTGPGGMLYTGGEGSAPLFPGSTIEVCKGQAMVDIAGQGTFTLGENSSMTFGEDGVPTLQKGTFEVRLLPGQEMRVITPKGELLLTAPEDKVALFSIEVGEGVRASGSGMIIADGTKVSPGQTLALGFTGGSAGAFGGSLTGLYVALGMSGVSAVTMAVGANQTHHHHREASPYIP